MLIGALHKWRHRNMKIFWPLLHPLLSDKLKCMFYLGLHTKLRRLGLTNQIVNNSKLDSKIENDEIHQKCQNKLDFQSFWPFLNNFWLNRWDLQQLDWNQIGFNQFCCNNWFGFQEFGSKIWLKYDTNTKIFENWAEGLLNRRWLLHT